MQNNSTSESEITIERLLNAPIDLVWEVWTNPEHIKNWWGPNGFSTTISKMDLVSEGQWNLTMHGPDGTDYRNESIFKEIIFHKKIVYEHISAPKFLTTITFEPQGSKTIMNWKMLFESPEQLEQVVKVFKADQGLVQNVDKLETYISTKFMENNVIKIEREFKAPIEKVWSAITNREQMKNWYFTFDENFRLEIGQEFEWSSPDEMGKIWIHKGKMIEIVENKKLVHTWEYPGYSGSSTLSWELFPIDENNTLLKLTHEFTIPFDIAVKALNISNFEAGWDSIVNGSLREFLEK